MLNTKNDLPAIYAKQMVQETPQYSQLSMATSSLLYSALGSSRNLAGRCKTLSQGLVPGSPEGFPPSAGNHDAEEDQATFPAAFRLFFAAHPPSLLSRVLPSSSHPQPLLPICQFPPAPNEQDPVSGLCLETICSCTGRKQVSLMTSATEAGTLLGARCFPRGVYRADLS